jgi:hypothetical protein
MTVEEEGPPQSVEVNLYHYLSINFISLQNRQYRLKEALLYFRHQLLYITVFVLVPKLVFAMKPKANMISMDKIYFDNHIIIIKMEEFICSRKKISG